jgi:Icc-related predicted phosphoesterase
MFTQGELVLSCWIIEAARSAVMDGRGHTESVARSAERARILARKCKEEGVAINPEFANAHSRWVAEVAGSEEDTGALGWFFLQRLGSYVDAHMSELLDPKDRDRLIELGAPDADAVNEAVGTQGLPPSPPPEFPESPEVHAPGKVRARIGVIGDPHIGLQISEPMISAAINDLNGQGVDLTIIVGDLTQNGKAELFTQARSVFEKLESPWIVTLGNHDMWGGHDTDKPVGLERFKSAFEREPFGVHETDDFRLVAINSADPSPSPFPPFDLTIGGFTDEPNESVPGGTISDEMAAWMAGIEPGPPTLVMLHHPPFPYMGFPPIVFGLDEASTKTLESFIDRIGAWGVICGHTHRSILHQLAGIPYLEVICSKEWPFGYGLIEMSDEGWSYNLKPISDADLVAKASARSGVLFRRYARGEEEARSFVWKARESAELP